MAGKCLAVITARGGSKRIPRKNIKEIAEECKAEVLFWRSAEAAQDMSMTHEVRGLATLLN